MIATITEQRMRQIAAEIIGTYINVDSAYGGQCWDSATYINEHYFGLPRINTGNTAQKSGRWPGWAGNMVDCFPQSQAIAEAYELVSPDQPVLPGDTLVWDDSNRQWYPATHVATAVVDTGRGWVLTLSQNSSAARPDLPGYSRDASGPVIFQTLPKEGLLGIIRPRTSGSGIDYAGTTIEPIQEDELSDAQVERIINELTTVIGQHAKPLNETVIGTGREVKELVKDQAIRINQHTQAQTEAVGRVTQQLVIDNAKPAVLADQIMAAGIAKEVVDLLTERLAS